ncbi:MAG: hypothetical protein NZ749_14735, partial [bacterium]|nr:hypothetical protein [bacterium]
MNRHYFTSWLLIGVLAGLGFGSYTLQASSLITADIARWSILLTLTAVALLLAMLWQPSELPRWLGRFARLLSVSGWIVLVA